MIEKLLRSIRTRGVIGTMREAVLMAIAPFRHPHFVQHLLVPWGCCVIPGTRGWAHDRVSSAGPAAQGLPWIAWPCIRLS